MVAKLRRSQQGSSTDQKGWGMLITYDDETVVEFRNGSRQEGEELIGVAWKFGLGETGDEGPEGERLVDEQRVVG